MKNTDTEMEMYGLIEKKFKDIKLETKILAFCLRRDFNIIFSLRKDFFTIEPYQTIFELLKEHKIIFPKDILFKFLKKRIDEEEFDIYRTFVSKLYDENLKHTDRKSIEHFIKDLKSLGESRNIIKGVNDIISDMDKFDVIKAKKILRNAIMTETSLDAKDHGEYLEDYEERKEEILKKKNDPRNFMGIPTGIKKLDDISGGLQKGELGIIVAPTGKGKSLALGNIAVNAWKNGYNVVVFSLEMTKHQLQYRFDSRVTKINHKKFRTAEIEKNEMELWQKKMLRLREKKENYLEIICMPRRCCAAEIEEECLMIQAKRKKKIDLVIIDYINLMSSNDGKGDKKDWKHQAEVGWNLKEFCQSFNNNGIPCWTANQLTDEGNTATKIETHHLKYARAISEVAQVILALTQSVDDALQDIMKMWIVKARDFENVKRPIILHPKFNIMVLNQEATTLEDIINRNISFNGEGNK